MGVDRNEWPQWLRDADTEDAVVGIIDGVVHWYGGVWHRGVWMRGTWCGGQWHNGLWFSGKGHGGDE